VGDLELLLPRHFLRENVLGGGDVSRGTLLETLPNRKKSAPRIRTFHRIHISGDTDYGFGAEKHILSVSAITRDAVDCLVVAYLEEAALA